MICIFSLRSFSSEKTCPPTKADISITLKANLHKPFFIPPPREAIRSSADTNRKPCSTPTRLITHVICQFSLLLRLRAHGGAPLSVSLHTFWCIGGMTGARGKLSAGKAVRAAIRGLRLAGTTQAAGHFLRLLTASFSCLPTLKRTVRVAGILIASFVYGLWPRRER